MKEKSTRCGNVCRVGRLVVLGDEVLGLLEDAPWSRSPGVARWALVRWKSGVGLEEAVRLGGARRRRARCGRSPPCRAAGAGGTCRASCVSVSFRVHSQSDRMASSGARRTICSPSSIALARTTSSSALRSGTLPISLRYIRTGSSMPTMSAARRRAPPGWARPAPRGRAWRAAPPRAGASASATATSTPSSAATRGRCRGELRRRRRPWAPPSSSSMSRRLPRSSTDATSSLSVGSCGHGCPPVAAAGAAVGGWCRRWDLARSVSVSSRRSSSSRCALELEDLLLEPVARGGVVAPASASASSARLNSSARSGAALEVSRLWSRAWRARPRSSGSGSVRA